jgi:transposase
VQAILDKHAVTDLLTVSLKLEVEQRTIHSYADRPARVEQKQRYVLSVRRKPAAIQAYEQTLGWRAYVTNTTRKQLPLAEAVQVYCDEWLIERDCQRLKGRPLSLSPLWLTREDHAIGLTRLLTLAARLLAVVEYDVRCQLHQTQRTLAGLFPGQATRTTDRPTTERLLKAFDEIALVVIRTGSRVQRYLTPLSALQKQILRLMHVPAALYSQLELDSG